MKQKIKILILDDNKLFCSLLDSLLGQEFLLKFVHNKIELFQLIKTENYNLIILNFCESHQENRRLINQVKENHKSKDVPVIAIISRIQFGALKKTIELGVHDVLIKPLNVQAFKNKINLLLNQ